MKNTSKLLAVSSAIGVVATAYLSARNTLCVSDFIKDPAIQTKEKIIVTTLAHFSTFLAAGATIGCIFMNQRYQSTILQNYILADQIIKMTPRRVELRGLPKDVNQSASDTATFYEYNLGDYIERRMIEVLDAEYQLNRKLVSEGYASLNDFFGFLGVETTFPENYGWSQEIICDFFQPPWIDFEHQLTILEDGMECYIIVPSMNPKFIELEE